MTSISKNKLRKYILTILSSIAFFGLQATDTEAQSIEPGVDLVSSYVWRGVNYSGPSIQPYINFTAGGFTLGAWGSQGIDGVTTGGEYSPGYQEMDLYTSYVFDFGLSLGLTDYYYPGTPYFNYKSDPDNGDYASHAFELNGGFTVKNLSLSANYILNESPGGAGSQGADVYFEAGYNIQDTANIFIGGGDGWHSTDGDFKIVNIGVSTSKKIKITDTFSLPVMGQAILNPDTKQFFILGGISL